MEQGNLFCEYEGPSENVRDARRRVRGAVSTLIGDVLAIPHTAESGLKRDAQRVSALLAPAALIRRYPAGAIALAVGTGLVVGRRLFDHRISGHNGTLSAAYRPAGSRTDRLLDSLRRTVRDKLATDENMIRARGIAVALAGRLASAAISRIISENVGRNDRHQE